MPSQSSGTNWPASLIEKPAGVCIQEFTARIQNADTSVPAATMPVAVTCRDFETRPMPKSITPRKPASMKKAVSTS